ncbi:hypothetical protein GCM10009757_52230 [Streptomyces cheonanensis]|uniref:Uncharacterized protein n=1 Tax=Streptomyces cheonanensis TaxID=312720 RepID=A0ABN2VMB7_9ACTN
MRVGKRCLNRPFTTKLTEKSDCADSASGALGRKPGPHPWKPAPSTGVSRPATGPPAPVRTHPAPLPPHAPHSPANTACGLRAWAPPRPTGRPVRRGAGAVVCAGGVLGRG